MGKFISEGSPRVGATTDACNGGNNEWDLVVGNDVWTDAVINHVDRQ